MIVGIAGGSCSGKTTLATRLAAATAASMVSLDPHFRDPATFPVVFGHPDYDRMEAVDWDGSSRPSQLSEAASVVRRRVR